MKRYNDYKELKRDNEMKKSEMWDEEDLKIYQAKSAENQVRGGGVQK